MNRSSAREVAFKLIYSLGVQKEENNEEQIELFFENNDIDDAKAKNYILDVIKGIEKNKSEIVKLIEENLKSDWSIERVSKIDVALIQLGIYEIIYTEVPYKVVINEVVELAKQYGEKTSKAFVNGILASVVKSKGL